jgi:hypothetical protein
VPDLVPRQPSKRTKPDALTLEDAVKDLFVKHPLPEDNTLYLTSELVQYTCDDSIKSPVCKLPIENVFYLIKNSSTITVGCSCKTLKKELAKHNKNRELPPSNDIGVAVGRKPIVPDNTSVHV